MNKGTTEKTTKIPLYKEVHNYREQWESCPQNAHTGLWYDKYCHVWENPKEKDWTLGESKIEWIRKVTKEAIGEPKKIKEYQERMKELVANRKGKRVFLRTSSCFVTGLGRSHPIENGFAWHPTLGVPYLSGSSVKGIVRAWAMEWAMEQKEVIKRIFGSDLESTNHEVGSVIFLDAVPNKPVKLEADVMTPHYSKYYEDPKKNPPIDGYSPIPIPFLVVSHDQSFVFAVAPRRANHKDDREDMATVCKWLEDALKWMGAGAKTAVGYGRFEKRTEK